MKYGGYYQVQGEDWRLRQASVEDTLHVREVWQDVRVPSQEPRQCEGRDIAAIRQNVVTFLVHMLQNLHDQFKSRNNPRLKILQHVIPNPKS